MKKVIISLVLILTISFTISAQVNPANPEKFLKLLNEYRESKGLSKLEYDTVIEKAAKLQCEYLFQNKVYENLHANKDLPNHTYRLSKVGYVSKASLYNYQCGENALHYINKKSTSPDFKALEYNILLDYENSEGHNITLLKPKVTKFGMYTIYDGNDLYNIMIVSN